MKKYLFLLKYELKTIVRSPINLYMCFFPILILILSTLVFPLIFESIETNALETTMLLLVIIILAFANFFLAAMSTFLLLEQKDENTLKTIAVTPIGTQGYLKFKLTYIYIMSVISNIIVIFGTKLTASEKYVIGDVSLFDNITILHIVTLAVVSGIFTIALSLIQAALAKNKVEGFAFIKASGMLALIPMIIIFQTFQDSLQYVLGIFPNFWYLKGMMLELFPISSKANLSYEGYLLIGALYNLFILLVAYRLFAKKIQY